MHSHFRWSRVKLSLERNPCFNGRCVAPPPLAHPPTQQPYVWWHVLLNSTRSLKKSSSRANCCLDTSQVPCRSSSVSVRATTKHSAKELYFIIKQNPWIAWLVFFNTQISTAILPRTLFPWHTSDNVPLPRHGADRFRVFKTTLN